MRQLKNEKYSIFTSFFMKSESIPTLSNAEASVERYT